VCADNLGQFERLLKISDVAERLNVSRWTVSRLLDAGDLPSIMIKGCKRVRPSDLARFIEKETGVTGTHGCQGN